MVKEEADKCKADCEKLLPLVQAERACGLGLGKLSSSFLSSSSQYCLESLSWRD